MVSARIALVDIMLRDSCPDHSRGTGHEAPEDLLERRELDTNAGEEGVELRRTVRRLDPGQDGEGMGDGRTYEEIAEGDEDDEGEGVEVVDDVVGNAVSDHGGGLGGQVVDDLVIREPCKFTAQSVNAKRETRNTSSGRDTYSIEDRVNLLIM